MANWKIYVILILPVFLTGVVHHFLIIRNNLFPYLAKPVDFGKSLEGKRIFGDKKTFRGFAVVTLLNSFFTALVAYNLNWTYLIKFPPLATGVLMGISYSLAELPTSFFKRRLNIPPSGRAKGNLGKFVNFIDQSDSVLGTLIAANFISYLSLWDNLLLFSIGFTLHYVTDILLYKFSYKKSLLQ